MVILLGISIVFDLCQAAPSHTSRISSSLNFFDNSERKRFIQSVSQFGMIRKKLFPVSGSTAP